MGLEALGYEAAVAGNNQWNGVVLLSRVGLEDVEVGFPGMPGWAKEGPEDAEARAVGATCAGVRVWSLYIPNGRKPDDPHYVYKLDWLARLREAARPWLDQQVALVGDWNICPTDDDVFDIAQFKNSTHVTPPERAAFQGFLDDGYAEVTRAHAPGYTYWDYYRQRFERDRGLKIDFALCSPTLAARVTGASIDRDERDPAQGTGSPSDHAPVIVDLSD
jgi:exodeoxyribonuclease-3